MQRVPRTTAADAVVPECHPAFQRNLENEANHCGGSAADAVYNGLRGYREHEGIKEAQAGRRDSGHPVTCADQINFVQFYLSGNTSTGFWGSYRFDAVATCAKGLKTRPIKAGRYYIGWVGIGQQGVAIAEPQAVSFTIETGKLNYIGDIYVGDVSPFRVDTEALLRITGNLVSVIDRQA